MAINIGENQNEQVTYVNSPDINRVLFKNLKEGASKEDIVDAVNDWLDDHPEATTTVEDGSILPVKLNATNNPDDEYVLGYDETTEKFVWININSELEDMQDDISDLKESLSELTPELYFTDKILCPDFSATVGDRSCTKINNVYSQKFVSSNATAKCVYISGTEYYTETKTVSSATPTTKQLVDISLLKQNYSDRIPVIDYYIDGTYTGSTGAVFAIWYCKVVDDTVTVISSQLLQNVTNIAKKQGFDRIPIENIPEDATHFVLGFYTAGAGPSFKISLEFYYAPVYANAQDVAVINSQIEAINNSLFEEKLISLDSANIYSSVSLNGSGKFAITSLTNNAAFYPIPSGTIKITITASSSIGSIYTLTTNTNHSIGSSPSYANGYSLRESIASGETVIISNVPSDARYIYYAVKVNAGDATPVIKCEISKFDGNNAELSEDLLKYVNSLVASYAFLSNQDGRDVPKNRGVMNTLRKIEQLRYTPYTLLSAIPSIGSIAPPSGDVVGMVYSSVKEFERYVPYDVSWITFMSAVHNPRSLLYTEDVLGSRSSSEYGFTYHGVNNCGPYFGSVCSSTIISALGIKTRWETSQFDYLAKIGVLTDIKDVSAYGVQLCDICWKEGHVVIVTDIWRDNRGIPTKIVIVQSVGNKIQTNTYNSAEAFNSFLSSGNYTHIYRYNFIDENLEYTPSPFITIDDELGTATPYTYNDDICTFMGDYAAFGLGDTIYLNAFNSDGYTDIVINDGTNSSTVPLINEETDYNITSLIEHAGFYTAWLTDGENNSEPTHFEVVDSSISVSSSGSNVTVEFNADASPLYIKIASISGTTSGLYEIKSSDGSVTFNSGNVCTEQTGSMIEDPYYSVIYQGIYGKVMSQKVKAT